MRLTGSEVRKIHSREVHKMRKKLAFLTASLVMAAALALPMSSPSAAGQSCMGKCKRAYNACINRGNNPPSCNASYQGCISSCK